MYYELNLTSTSKYETICIKNKTFNNVVVIKYL